MTRPRRATGAKIADRAPTTTGASSGHDALALVTALRVGQRGVEHRDPIPEARAESSDRLRCERDLRDEHDHPALARERSGGGLDVHLGLPAPGRPVQQHVSAVRIERSDDPLDARALLRSQLCRLGLAAEGVARSRIAASAAPPSLEGRDERQRTCRRGSVVVGHPERELDERRGDVVDDGARIGDLDAGGSDRVRRR